MTQQRGERGQSGERGQLGERGPKGDHGQDGKTGPALLSRIETLVLLAFVVAVALLLAWRSQVNTNGIKDNARLIVQNQYDQCQARNANIAKLNNLYGGLVKIERHNPFVKQGPAAAATVQRRIELYTANKLLLIDCGVRP